jgi:hypothetical protein
MPKTLEATRSSVWADSVAVDVRGWIWVINPICRVSLGRKYVDVFSFNPSESWVQNPVNTAILSLLNTVSFNECLMEI